MKVFISYGSALDQVTALRLQALGAVNGLTVYVPPAYTRQPSSVSIEPETAQKLADADVVLGIVSVQLTGTCEKELNTGRILGKPIIVMAGLAVAPLLQPYFGQSLVVIDPANPDETELGVVRHLKSLDAGQQAKKALIALGTLALGLVIVGLVSSSQD